MPLRSVTTSSLQHGSQTVSAWVASLQAASISPHPPQVTDAPPTGWLLSALPAPALGLSVYSSHLVRQQTATVTHHFPPLSLGTKDTEWAAESDGLEVTLTKTPSHLFSYAHSKGACRLITNLSRGLKLILPAKHVTGTSSGSSS